MKTNGAGKDVVAMALAAACVWSIRRWYRTSRTSTATPIVPPTSETPVRAFDPISAIDLRDDETHVAIDRAQSGEPLSGKELAAIFRVKHAQFHNLAKAGAWDIFLLKPAIGSKRYSGVKVYRHLCGDPVYEPTFGRKRQGR
jgi:hypothetical protein